MSSASTPPSAFCSFCREPCAAEQVTLSEESAEPLCTRCRDHEQAVDEYQQLAPTLDSLERQGKVDEALALLNQFLQTNRHRDREQWLARHAASARQSLLYFADRDLEALQASEDAEKLGFANVAERWAHARSKALALQALGKPDDALRTFEDAFHHQDPAYNDAAPYFFRALIQFYADAGKPVDPRWLPVADAAAKQ